MSDVIKKFLKLEAASGIILIMAAMLAMILVNTALDGGYQAFLDTPVQVRIAALDINKPLLLWINDGFMAIFFLLVGLVIWVAVLKSGVHATLAGVVVGFMVPLNGKRYASRLKYLEHQLHPWSAYLILPLFAFANAGVSLEGIGLSSLLSPVPMRIMLELFIGKPLGVFTISWLAIKLSIAQLPPGVNFKQIFAVSILCGIGFTMSMFIASLAFEHGGLDYGSFSRLGILVSSTMAAAVGYLALRMVLPKGEAEQSTEGL